MPAVLVPKSMLERQKEKWKDVLPISEHVTEGPSWQASIRGRYYQGMFGAKY